MRKRLASVINDGFKYLSLPKIRMFHNGNFWGKEKEETTWGGGGTELPISHLLPVFKGRKLKNGIDNSVFSTIEVP